VPDVPVPVVSDGVPFEEVLRGRRTVRGWSGWTDARGALVRNESLGGDVLTAENNKNKNNAY
jgi:hypothetical protein